MAEVTNIIKYGSRTFSEIRTDLINYIRRTYPEVLSDFTDSSVGAMLIDINAGVGNNLAINTDRAFQETQLEYVQQRNNLLNIAKNMGFNVPPIRPAVTVVDYTVTVPVLGDKPDASYYPTLGVGAQAIGAGKVFETQDVIDWNSAVSSLGDVNRSIIPNLDSNGITVSYDVTKREVVVNGASNIYKRTISAPDVIPFFTVTLPDNNVLQIDGVYLVQGTNFTTTPTDKFVDENRYYEVDYLAQQRVFVQDTLKTYGTDATINGSPEYDDRVKPARWIDVTKKFIKEYTANGLCKLTFGSGDSDVNAFKEGFLKEGVSNRYFLENFLNNTALGEKLIAGYTLFVKYRSGGGSSSNVGAGTLTQLGTYTMTSQGARLDYRQNVQRSLRVNNPIPAIGGNDGLSVEQIRQLIKYNFSSQNRDVTLTDYLLQVYKMPGRFGSPFRANTFKQNNKVLISILGINSEGKLDNTSNTLLKENLAEYLSQYRMINDYVEIRDGKVYNLGFDIDVYVGNISDNEMITNIVSVVRNYLDINDYEMNEDLFLGRLERQILDVNGVVNILDIKVYNKVGGNYSNNIVPQQISNPATGQIAIINNTIYSAPDSMFEIKYPQKDIRVYLRKSVR